MDENAFLPEHQANVIGVEMKSFNGRSNRIASILGFRHQLVNVFPRQLIGYGAADHGNRSIYLLPTVTINITPTSTYCHS